MITIAIPAYKPYFLKQAIQSVLAQSYDDFEFIIVNDCSPSDIDAIVNSFHDERIRYFKNDRNLGKKSLVQSWNKCLEYARGEYFVLFSDDDIYHPDFLKELVSLTNKYPQAHVFHSRVKKINEMAQTIGYTPTCPEFENVLDSIWHTIFGYRTQFAPDFMCRTDSLKKIGGFYDLPLAWGSDYITWFTLAALGGVAYTPKALCYWRQSKSNLTSSGSIERRLEALVDYQEWMQKFLKEYNAQNNDEMELKAHCIKALPEFFAQKRQFLLSLQLSSKSFCRTIATMLQNKKTFSLPYHKVFLQTMKQLSL